MTGRSVPPGARIIGHEIHRRVAQSEIPPHLSLKAHEVRGVLGADGYKYIIPPGIDPLELGVITSPGQFDLVPIAPDGSPLWEESINVLVTEARAEKQRDIVMGFYRALLEHIPYDAGDLDLGVQADAARGVTHVIFGLLRRAAIETWAEHRSTSDLLDEPERARLYAVVARRTAELLHEMAPPCRLDRESLRAALGQPAAWLWTRIHAAIAGGDYDDATLRVLARIQSNRGLELPVACVAQVLPGVRQLEICFAFIRRAKGDVADLLADWLRDDPLGAESLGAEQAVCALYAVWRLKSPEAARPILRSALTRLVRAPVSTFAAGLMRWLGDQTSDDSLRRTLAERAPASPSETRLAVVTAERALAGSLDDILAALPERAP